MIMPWVPVPDANEYLVDINGEVYSTKVGRVLLPQMSIHGYLQVNLNGTLRKVHEVVLTTFKGVRPEGMVGRHLDGDSLNNDKSNLEWGTPSQNTQDQIKHGTMRNMFPKGESHPNSTTFW